MKKFFSPLFLSSLPRFHDCHVLYQKISVPRVESQYFLPPSFALSHSSSSPIHHPFTLLLSFALSDPCRNKTTCWVELGTRRMVVQSSSQACSLGGEPVCASDGQTYNNTCQMKHASIQRGVTLRELHRGPCKKRGENRTCSSHLQSL